MTDAQSNETVAGTHLGAINMPIGNVPETVDPTANLVSTTVEPVLPAQIDHSPAAAAPNAGITSGKTPEERRAEIRSKIFSVKPRTELVTDFYGVDIELRQPSLEVTLEARQTVETEYVYSMLLDYAYVPGTSLKVFEPEDVDSIRQMPFSDDMNRMITAVNRLLGVDATAVDEMLKDATKSTEE